MMHKLGRLILSWIASIQRGARSQALDYISERDFRDAGIDPLMARLGVGFFRVAP